MNTNLILCDLISSFIETKQLYYLAEFTEQDNYRTLTYIWTNLKTSRVQPKVDVKNGQSMQVTGLLCYSSSQIIYFLKSLNNNRITIVRLAPQAFKVGSKVLE